MSCGFDTDAEKFRNFCLGTARRYVELYNWYPIPTSCHIIPIHGADIIESLSVPLDFLSKDAQEARNKDIKYIREHNYPKCSRQKTMEDVFKRLLLSSDPLILSYHKIKVKKKLFFESKSPGTACTIRMFAK